MEREDTKEVLALKETTVNQYKRQIESLAAANIESFDLRDRIEELEAELELSQNKIAALLND